jgi:GcrA cell cycle regulator
VSARRNVWKAAPIIRATPPTPDAKLFMALDRRECKWPLGSWKESPIWFCGHCTEPGRPYCVHHAIKSRVVRVKAENA